MHFESVLKLSIRRSLLFDMIIMQPVCDELCRIVRLSFRFQ